MGEAKRRAAWVATGRDWGPRVVACTPRRKVPTGLTAERLKALEDERDARRSKDKLLRCGFDIQPHRPSKHRNPPRRSQARG